MCGGDRWQIPVPHDSKHSWFSQSLLGVVVRKMYVNMSCRATAQPPHPQVSFLTTARALLPQLIDGGEFAGSKRAWLMYATPPPRRRHFNGNNRLARLGRASTADFLIQIVRLTLKNKNKNKIILKKEKKKLIKSRKVAITKLATTQTSHKLHFCVPCLIWRQKTDAMIRNTYEKNTFPFSDLCPN